MTKASRYERGLRLLSEIDGKAGEEVKESLMDIAPDLGDYIVEYAFGDIYARPVLDLKSKEIAVVAALTAIGTAEPQLKVHINGALNVGSSINEVKEVILQMSGYSGFPSTINAMNALKEVIETRKAQGIKDREGKLATKMCSETDRFEQGSKMLAVLDEAQLAILESTYNDFAPDLVKLVVNSYADVISRDNLDLKYRQIATISALAAMGNARPQLKFHIKAGLNIGLTKEEITEIMYLMTVYTGFPSAINGVNVLKEVLTDNV